MADHPLRPATDHRLGEPLPHQLANPTRAPPRAINLSPRCYSGAYAVLARLSPGYPPLQGRFPRVTHPCATRVLLHAFDLHVLGMPPAFVLSQDQTLNLASVPPANGQNQAWHRPTVHSSGIDKSYSFQMHRHRHRHGAAVRASLPLSHQQCQRSKITPLPEGAGLISPAPAEVNSDSPAAKRAAKQPDRRLVGGRKYSSEIAPFQAVSRFR